MMLSNEIGLGLVAANCVMALILLTQGQMAFAALAALAALFVTFFWRW